eukprot:1156622-Pelagomonas_calceolata.AAC.3
MFQWQDRQLNKPKTLNEVLYAHHQEYHSQLKQAAILSLAAVALSQKAGLRSDSHLTSTVEKKPWARRLYSCRALFCGYHFHELCLLYSRAYFGVVGTPLETRSPV